MFYYLSKFVHHRTPLRRYLVYFKTLFAFHILLQLLEMFVFSNPYTESSDGHGQDILKSSHESSYFCLNPVNESTGSYITQDPSAYSIAKSLSEECEDRCTSLSHNVFLSCSEVQANINSTSVCLSSTESAKQSQKQKLPVAATQSSLMLSTFTLQSPCEPCDTRESEMHATLPSSTLTVCYHSADAI